MTAEKDKEQQEYEERLQRRLRILKKQFDEGKVKIADGLKVIDSLKAVRLAPDGSIDLDTVDGLVRSMALGVEVFHDREELKKEASLAEIQTMYFEFMEKNFGFFYEPMLKKGLSPHDVGMSLSREEETINELTKDLPDFLNTISEFWKNLGDIVHVHIEDMHTPLKGVYGGSLFPSNQENIASKCGIYTDTIILPCPFLRSLDLFTKWSPEKQAYYLLKHGLNLLQYKELACADVDPPIVVVVPDYTLLDNDERDFIARIGEQDTLVHSEKLFGRRFESMAELIEFSNSLDTMEKVLKEIKDDSRVLFDTEWPRTAEEQIKLGIDHEGVELLGTKHPGRVLVSQAFGRMGTTNELLMKAGRLRGTPVLDVPTSWQYVAWKLEYDSEHKSEKENVEDLHILRGLQSLSGSEMKWLGKVPPKALIEIREQDALHEIRELLGNGIDELVNANPANFHRTTDQVFDNLDGAFEAHRKAIRELSDKKWKFAGSDIGSWFVVGSLAITAAATGVAVWGIAAVAADQLLDAPKLKDIPKGVKEFAKESAELNRSPVGMLFKVREDET
jgi:hypothetical protein